MSSHYFDSLMAGMLPASPNHYFIGSGARPLSASPLVASLARGLVFVTHLAESLLRHLGGCIAVCLADSLLHRLGGWAIARLADSPLHRLGGYTVVRLVDSCFTDSEIGPSLASSAYCFSGSGARPSPASPTCCFVDYVRLHHRLVSSGAVVHLTKTTRRNKLLDPQSMEDTIRKFSKTTRPSILKADFGPSS